jgi:hypothetical protein
MTACSESIVPMREWIRQSSALKRSTRGLFLHAPLVLPAISLSLQWLGFRKTKASLQHFLSVRSGSQNADAQAGAALTAQRCELQGAMESAIVIASRNHWQSGGYSHGKALLPTCAWEFAKTVKNSTPMPGLSAEEHP